MLTGSIGLPLTRCRDTSRSARELSTISLTNDAGHLLHPEEQLRVKAEFLAIEPDRPTDDQPAHRPRQRIQQLRHGRLDDDLEGTDICSSSCCLAGGVIQRAVQPPSIDSDEPVIENEAGP
ncbi:MAG: hypothetical protein M3228_07375 [Actinomycetota bacterium]|nr:hypothetical protein [Actinomycetota bacterium]